MKKVPEINMNILKYSKLAFNDPIELRTSIFKKYGDISYKNILGYKNYLTCNPDHVQHILQGNQDNYLYKHAFVVKSLIEFMGKESLFFNNNLPMWKKDRPIYKICFEPTIYYTNYAKTISSRMKNMIAELKKTYTQGELINIADFVDKLIIGIVMNSLFYHINIDELTMANYMRKGSELAKEKFSHLIRFSWYFSPKKIELARIMKLCDNYFDQIIGERIQSGETFDDVLGIFMHEFDIKNGSASPHYETFKHHISTFIVVSYFTSTSLLHSAFFVLSKHPYIAENILNEIENVIGDRDVEYNDLEKFTYLQAVIKEIQRLYPSNLSIMRESINEDELYGFYIPKGAGMTISTHHLNRYPGIWDNPEGFDPTRFIKKPLGQDHPFGFIPFGSGKRSCIAANFTLMEISIALIHLLKEIQFTLPPYTSVKYKLTTVLTMRPDFEFMNIYFK